MPKNNFTFRNTYSKNIFKFVTRKRLRHYSTRKEVSTEFIRSAVNSASINKAVIQEKQLNYILNSKLQEDRFDTEYLKQWADRKCQSDDAFLNWVKSIFKTENFLTFFKYLRFPLPSTKIIHNRIEPQLMRVFNAEDANFTYDVKGRDFADFEEDLEVKRFNRNIFDRLLYKHNSLIVADLDPLTPNKPYRYFIDITDVKSLEEKDGKVTRIAFKGCVTETEPGEETEAETGYIYIDSQVYSFYDDSMELIREVAHDLGYCPVHFISPKKYNDDCVVRESLFTYVREEIEEFNFMKTLQRMTEPNGAIPVVSKIQSTKKKEGSGGPEGEQDINKIMGSAKSDVYNQNVSLGTGDLQPGTIHEIPIDAIRSDDGSINMDAVKNYLNFHYIPIEALDYLNRRIQELERSIVSTIVGDVLESSEASKNQDQIAKSISILENTLMSFAESLNRIRKYSDRDMLCLKYGSKLVNEVFIHYGTDFFLDSQSKLFEDLGKAPNTLERKNIIVRISQNRYKNNQDQMSRQKLLYDLMPYVSDIDFDKAIAQQIVNPVNKEYQLRFNYWIDQFEAYYGNIVQFYKDMEISKAEKLVLINNLITDLINKQLIVKQNEPSNLA